MNNFEYNKTSNSQNCIVDVPYYTRELCKDNKYRVTKRNINVQNVVKYRKIVDSIQINNDYFLTKNLQQNIKNAVKILK